MEFVSFVGYRGKDKMREACTVSGGKQKCILYFDWEAKEKVTWEILWFV
jgi:hypothetical protein